MSHYFLCSQNKHSIIYRFFQLLAAKQNQKFPFHFLSAPPTPPATLNQKGRKIFGFCPRESASAPEAQSERTIQSKATTRAERAISRNRGSTQNTFELCPIHTAKIQNRNWKPKWGRAVGATQMHSRQKFPNLKGFSTLRVAPSFANTKL